MRAFGHTAISLAAGSIVYNYSHSFLGFLWFSIVGIFIDLDHYVDYIREHGISFDCKEVYNTCKYGHKTFRKLTLVLHSYELLLSLWLAIILFNLSILWKYVAISFTLHLFIDQITNPISPFGYFFWFRIANNFETKKIFMEKGVDYARRYG